MKLEDGREMRLPDYLTSIVGSLHALGEAIDKAAGDERAAMPPLSGQPRGNG